MSIESNDNCVTTIHNDSTVSLTSLWSVEFDDELVESPKDRHLMFTFYSDTG